MYDNLTEIACLSMFLGEAEEILKKNVDKTYAIIVFDVDEFSIINELYGYDEGDQVLQYIVKTLKTISKHSLYCRLYSDNFAILMEYQKDTDLALFVINLAEEVAKCQTEYEIMLSFGACKVDSKDEAVNVLCNRASLAKKTVKGDILQPLAFYDDTLRKKGIHDKNMEHEMTQALDKNEFEMYLQPKILIPTTEVVGAEALARWVHPTKGIIEPNEFIPFFEKKGFIVKLDYYIWEQAFATIRKWMDNGYQPIPISVNVSRIHLQNMNIIDKLVNLAEKYQVPKELIELELTETAFLNNLEKFPLIVNILKKEGFILSIDDFGTGYSTMDVLKDVSVDIIKIDKAFVNEKERCKTLIQHMIALAKQLNMDVVAEGVENFMQAKFLYETGCEIAQGSFYSMPISIPKFEQYTFGISI